MKLRKSEKLISPDVSDHVRLILVASESPFDLEKVYETLTHFNIGVKRYR